MKMLIRTSITVATIALYTSCAAAQSPQKTEIIVVIDPGHGGKELDSAKVEKMHIDRLYSSPNNATTPDGDIKEKDMTWELSQLIKKEIDIQGAASNPKVRAVLTCNGDDNPDMLMRAQVAAQNKASSFVSIHFNASDSHAACGPRAFVPGASERKPKELRSNVGGEFAVGLVQAVANSLPTSLRNKDITVDIGDEVQPEHQIPMIKKLKSGVVIRGSHLFHQLRRLPETAAIPACFLEVEFMDNPKVSDVLLKGG